jgi:hypothetical protein
VEWKRVSRRRPRRVDTGVMPRRGGPPPRCFLRNPTAMDDDGAGHDAFATDALWTPSPFFQDPATYETSLFAPIQLDGKSRRVPQFTRRPADGAQSPP